MKNRYWIVVFLLTFGLFGCPSYQSEVPIDVPNVKVNINHLGRWEAGSGMEIDKIYTVTKKSDFIYEIRTEGGGDVESDYPTEIYYDGHFSNVGSSQFINIKERKDQAKYMLYRIEVSGSTAVLSEITSNIKESFATSAELKSFVEKYMGVSFFYGEELTLFKK